MLRFGKASHDSHQKPSSLERWLVGALAGAALAYLLGKGLGLGQQARPGKQPGPQAESENQAP